MLHVTNGDAAAGALRHAGFREEILPWRDVLHEGPVREGLSLAELSAARARFIADAGWAPFEKVRDDFRERDRILSLSGAHDEVVLWFEHDLYDQLQLIQLLDWFAAHPHPRVSLVCEAQYVSLMSPARMRALFDSRSCVCNEIFLEGRDSWAAWRSSDPSRIPTTTKLPFLGAAFRRHLQEFPWTTDGLSLLERRVLDALASGAKAFPALFESVKEDPAYLGDTVLLRHLARMEDEGLLERRHDAWVVRSRTRLKRVPRWLGGVLVDAACPWRWDPLRQRLVKE